MDPAGFASENPLFREGIISRTSTHSLGAEVASEPAGRATLLSSDSLTPEELICFPVMIPGYSLSTKHVGFFHVGDLRDPSWEDEEANKTFHSSDNMSSILGIISGFSYESHSFGYSIAGKGKGLVFLFFGPSGTGKTLTAGTKRTHSLPPLFLIQTVFIRQSQFIRNANYRCPRVCC